MPVPLRSIFISYSHHDTKFVDRLRADLETSGFSTWIDTKGLKPGTDDWDDALREAVRASSAVVLVASPSSRRAKVVKDELRIADMYRIIVIPVWAEGDQWMDSIPVGRGGMQYCDARGTHYDGAVRELVGALQSEPINDGATPKPEDPPAPEPPTTVPPETNADLQVPWSSSPPRNPYKGLQAFTETDNRDFFGREALVADLVSDIKALLQAAPGEYLPERLLAVLGPSGSGKSSVVMAGLLPTLQSGTLPGSSAWVYLDPMVPGVHPMEALATTLSRCLPQRSMQSLLEDLGDDDSRGLHLLACSISREPGALVVLMIDQFEELFNLPADERERQQFIDLLLTAVTEPHGPVLLVLTLRADFYDRPMQYPPLYQVIQRHQRSVLPLEIEELRAVIEMPAQLPDVQVTFEGPLVGDLLFEVYKEVGGLPLLEFTLDQLFRRRSDHVLTQQAYKEIGGVRGALTKQAEDTYEGLRSDEHRQLARVLFLRLIDPGETEQDTTRRRAALQELILANAQRSEILREVTDAFVHARLLVQTQQEGMVTVEVAHEALIREWPRLRDWLRECRDDIQLQQRISQDAHEWQKAHTSERRRDLVYRGAVLTEAQVWRERGEPSAVETAFIEAAEEAGAEEKKTEIQRREQEQAMRRRNRTLGLGLIGAVSLMLIISLIAFSSLQHQQLVDSQALLAGTYIVTTTSDSGPGSLRQEIRIAPPGSAIVFRKGLKGMIVLQSKLQLTKSLDIDGPGSSILTISGNRAVRIFDISDNVAVTVSGLTMTGGDALSSDGGAIYVGDQSLDTGSTYVYSVVTLFSVTVEQSHADQYGGGIMNEGVLSVFDSTITQNTADYGGGVAITNGGYTVLNSSLVQSNQSKNSGGGIYNDATGYFYLNNSGVSGNSAPQYGGVYNVPGSGTPCGAGNGSSITGNQPDDYNVSCSQSS